MTKYLLVALLAVGLVGCATKNYGRQGQLSDYEKQTMSCSDIDLEEAKVGGWMATINQESGFDGRDALAVMGDFGIGNSMEKRAALKSANARLCQLQTLAVSKQCRPEPPVEAVAPPKPVHSQTDPQSMRLTGINEPKNPCLKM
jgi:hypothetical protein